MAFQAQPGKKFQVTVKRAVTRENAVKTLERIFMKDRTTAAPVVARMANFVDKPKRRGGRIWTKYANKVHLTISAGTTATVLATAQHARDLNSVAEFIDVATV